MRSKATQQQATWFNRAEHFKEATGSVLDARSQIFAQLGRVEAWVGGKAETGDGTSRIAERMRRVAELCAQERARFMV